MKPGDLYKCSKHSLLLFPTTPTAAVAVAVAAAAVAVAPAWTMRGAEVTAFWSREFSCRVTYIPAEELFMILTLPDGEPDRYGYHQIQVLHGETVWWINWNPDWMKFEKVTE